MIKEGEGTIVPSPLSCMVAMGYRYFTTKYIGKCRPTVSALADTVVCHSSICKDKKREERTLNYGVSSRALRLPKDE